MLSKCAGPLCALVALALLLAGGLAAQTTFATVTGTVADSSGAVIPGAAVTAINVATNIETATEANAAGIYTLAQLKEGEYVVRLHAAGFKDYIAKSVILAARDLRRIDATLEVGAVATQVEVAAGATLIETETARINSTQSSAMLNTIPVVSRGIWGFMALAPGVQQQNGSSVVRFAGSRVNQGNYAIDGISFADGVDNSMTGPMANYIESFAENRIDLANNSAEFGAVGQMTLISKSGTNRLHGSVFDYYSTPMFRARPTYSSARQAGIQHQPGASLGGPVFLPRVYDGRNRTFFFYSLETARGSQAVTDLNPTVPLAAWRNGDFSGLAATVYDPSSGLPFAGNRIPATRINPVSQKIQDRFYPLPNAGDTSVFHSQNYRETKTRVFDPSTYWTTRIDHKLSERDTLFGRVTWHRLYNRPWEGNLPTIGQRDQRRDNRGGTISWSHTFSPTMLNEFRWGFVRNNNPVIGPVNGSSLVKELGLTGLAPGLPTEFSGLLKVYFSGSVFTPINQSNYSGIGFRTHTEEFQDHFSWFRNRHSLKFGFNVLRSEYDEYRADNNLFGYLTFGSRFSSAGNAGQGQPYADFLLGIPTSARRSSPPLKQEANRWSYDFYALDDFRVNSKLTLNFGLRYELHQPWRDNNNRMSIFDVTTGRIVVPDGALAQVSPLFPKNFVGIVEAGSLGLPGRSLMFTDRNNFAPRIGLAYRPWGPKTVFRAGWGMFYDVVPFIYGFNFGGSPYILTDPTYTNPTSSPDLILPRVFPTGGSGGPGSVDLPRAMNPNFRTPYTMQYNVTIERQFGANGVRLSYIGTAGRKSAYAYNYNAPVPDGRPYTEKPRPLPQFGEVLYVTNGAGHQYNGLTLEGRREMTKGLYFQSSWTWARDRYDMDYNGDFDDGSSNWLFTLENPFNRAREVGPARDVPTHRWTSNWVYQLPFGRGKKWLGNVSRIANFAVGGWELSGLYTAQSGPFLTPFWTGPDPVGITYTDSDPAEVTIRPNILRDPNFAQRSPERWLDPTAFTAPQAGQFGTSGKGVIKGPGLNMWGMGLQKDFLLKEGLRLRWDMIANNVFNHPNYSPPTTDISDPTGVGVISATGGATPTDQSGARFFRMGVRLSW